MSPRQSEQKNEMTIERYHSIQTQIHSNTIKGTSGTLKSYQTIRTKCDYYSGYDFHYDYYNDYYNNYYNYYYNDYNNHEVGLVSLSRDFKQFDFNSNGSAFDWLGAPFS